MATILVVDDELGIRALLSEILSDEGHTIELAENATQARSVRERMRPDLVLLDIWMPDVDGITLLKEWGNGGLLTMPVVMMSGHGTIDTAVEATRFGAIDFLEKPISMQKLLSTIKQALSQGLPTPLIRPIAPEPEAAAPVEAPVIPAGQDFPLPLDVPLRQARDYFDAYYLQYHLRKEDENISRVAEKIGIERTHLYRKLKQLGIKPLKKGGDSPEQ